MSILLVVMEGNEKEKEGTESDLEKISSKLDDKMVVSIDEVNWERAGEELKWAMLIKLVTGKAIRKGMVVDVLRKVWKLEKRCSVLQSRKEHNANKLRNSGGFK